MKKKLLVAMLAAVLTMNACLPISGNTVESTETQVSTEAVAQAETEGSTEKVTEITEVIAESEVATEAVETTETAEGRTEEEPEFLVTAMEAIKYAKSSVNVRKGPSTDYEKVGSLSTNDEVKVLGQADTGWYQIRLGSEIAYVSNNYLVDEKVVVKEEVAVVTKDNSGVVEEVSDSVESSVDSVEEVPSVVEPSVEVVVPDVVPEIVPDTSVSEKVADVGNNSQDDGWVPDDEASFEISGSFDPATDGYGPGVEIEITPLP